MKYKLNPLQRFVLFLVVYASFAAVSYADFSLGLSFNQQIIWHLFATLGLGVALFYFFTKVWGKKKSIWNTIATALILFLIVNPGYELFHIFYPLAATLIAITYKFFFEYKGRPIINPVVFAILLLVSITILIPGVELPFISWWGASFMEPLALLLVAVWILAGLNVWKKWYLFGSFMAVYAVFVYFSGGMEFLKFVFTTGNIYFFAAVMLIEPKTSPVKKNQQLVCGVFTGLAYAALLYYDVNYAALIAIAAMNVLNFAMSKAPKKKSA